jgi:hypothetical protein
MGCDPDDYPVRDREKLRKLAAEIAECIINGGLLDEPGSESVPVGRRVCPPNKLCCWLGYHCSVPFYCDDNFGCIDRFSVSVMPSAG